MLNAYIDYKGGIKNIILMKNENGDSNYLILIMVYSTMLLTMSSVFYLIKEMVNEFRKSGETKKANKEKKN